jgi:branched-chain amino acid transport system ATP-binding protein
MLKVENVDGFYGGSQVLFGITLEVMRGEVVCLLGRNGVGKTTTMKTIMGLVVPRNGTIKLNGEEINGNPPFVIARLGIGYVPQGRRIFTNLSTRENLLVSQKIGSGVNPHWTLDRVYGLFPILKERQNERAEHLSGGEQQMLSIARSLMGNPQLLLLDEPFEGLASIVIKEVASQIGRLREMGFSILLAEQNINLVVALSSRCYVLEKGRVCYQNTTNQLTQNKEMIQKYLGV